jgi:archaemetzincin
MYNIYEAGAAVWASRMIMKISGIFLVMAVVATAFPMSGAAVKQGTKKVTVALLPLGNIDVRYAASVGDGIKRELGFDYRVLPQLKDIESGYDAGRKQYRSQVLLDITNKMLPVGCLKIIGIADVDLYAEGFNYVLGQADKTGGIISVYRFKPSKWRAGFIEKTKDRAVKTAIHELGHTFGLEHCSDPSCVMYFSYWVGDTDRKSRKFCKKHKAQFDKAVIGSSR